MKPNLFYLFYIKITQHIMIAITNQVIPSSSLSNSPLATVAIPLATPPIITKTIKKIKNKIQNMCLII